MKIEVPKFAVITKDEGLMLMSAWLYKIAKADKFANSYYIHSSDIRYIIQKYTTTPHHTFKDLLGHLKVGIPTNHVWQFQFEYEPDVVEYEFKDSKFPFIFGYLLGREASGQLITESNGIQPKKDAVMPREMRDYFRYYGMIEDRMQAMNAGKKTTKPAKSTVPIEIQEQIYAKHQEGGWTYRKLAKHFGVGYNQVYNLIHKYAKNARK